MEVLGHDTTQEQVKEGDHSLPPEIDSKRNITSGQVADGPTSFGVADNSSGTHGVVNERDPMANDNVPKDAVDEWPMPKRIHTFYFVKYRPYEDIVLKAKIEQAEKDLQKKNQARQQIIEALKTKRSEKSNIISQLKPLTAEDKEYRMKVDEKLKVMRPIRGALDEMRSANNAAREKGMGLCSSEEELDDILRSLHYRMQHESLSLNEEKRMLKEIKQLEGTREKVIANSSQRAKIQESLGQKEALQGQVKLISGDIDEVKKEQQTVRAKISLLESDLKVINDGISSLQEQLAAITEKRDKAYETITELRKTRDEMNACFFQNRSLLNTAKSLAANKKISDLQELSNAEVEKFLSQWSSDKDFRVDYERRILSSLDSRQLSRDGRIRNPDEKPILYEAPTAKEVELAPTKSSVKGAEDVSPPVQHETVPSYKAQDDNLSKPKQVKSTVKAIIPEDTDDYFVSEKSLNESKAKEIDAAKLKEIKKEEELSKAKQALERKKKLAEKAAAKAAAKAQKEAEKKLKEKEKKTKKKAEATAPAATDEEAEAETKDAEPEANVDVNLDVPVPAKRKEQKDNTKYRTKTRGRDSKVHDPIQKVILRRKKSSSYWLWAAPSAAAALVLAMLGFYFSVVRK